MTNSEKDQLAHLLALADELAQETQKLSGKTADNMVRLSKRTTRNSTLIWGLAGSFLLDILLTIILAFGLVQIDNNQDDINAVTDRLDNAQSEQRQRGLCPLYALFYDLTDTPEERKAGKARSDSPEKYDAQVRVIEQGYKNLKCAEFKGDAPGLPR